MKRFAVALLILFVAGCPAPAQTLDVKGDVKTVLIVSKFPVTVTAPANGLMRQWQVPAGVKATDNGASLQVDDAPAGELTIGVRYVTIDWDAKKADEVLLRTTFLVGGVPGPGPGPTPIPDDARPSAELVKAMQDAYAAETDPRKQDHAARLAIHWAGLIRGLKASGQVATTKDFEKIAHDSTNFALADEDLPKGNGASALPVVRMEASKFWKTRLPQAVQPVDAAFWTAASIAFSQVSQALKATVK